MKILFILHHIHKSLGIEWLANGLLDYKIHLTFVLINDETSEMEVFLHSKGIPVFRMPQQSKVNAPLYLLRLCKLINKIKPDVVHTHLRNADLYGQTAAFLCGVKKRIYTRHSSTYNHLYHKKSVAVDRAINFLATDIIAISGVVEQVLTGMENVPNAKITLIYHGFDLDAFANVDEQRVNILKAKYLLPKNKMIIGVFARYVEWKGYQYIIPAFAALKKTHPDLHIVFANTAGDYQPVISSLLKEYLLEGDYTEIRFENDVQALYKLLDLYLHVPVDGSVEAFGQTYVEALASGIPSVFTLSGIANEFIVNDKNALVVDYKSTEQIQLAVERLLTNESLQATLIKNGMQDVKRFALDTFIKKHIQLYLN